jgi:hypothetical protein
MNIRTGVLHLTNPRDACSNFEPETEHMSQGWFINRTPVLFQKLDSLPPKIVVQSQAVYGHGHMLDTELFINERTQGPVYFTPAFSLT